MFSHQNDPDERSFLQREEKSAVSLGQVNWKRLLSYLNPYAGKMFLAILALLFSTGMGILFPLVIVKLLDSVTKAATFGPINQLTGLLLGMFLVQAIFNFFQSYLLNYIGEKIVYDLRTSLYGHLQSLSLGYFSNHRVGDMISRLSSDVTQMRTLLTTGLTSILTQILNLVGSIIILLSMNAKFTLFILGLSPVLVAIAVIFGRIIRTRSLKIQDELADSTIVAEEGLQAIRVVKSFGRETHEINRYKGAMNKTFQASLKLAVYSSAFMSLMMFIGFGSISAIMWYGGRQVINGSLSLAMITGFLIYGVTIAASLGGLSSLFAMLNQAVGGIQRVFEILDSKPDITDDENAIALTACSGKIQFDHVSFGYNGDDNVLDDINLEVKESEILAVVGLSGAGKSTLFNLIPRLYDPTSGRILLDREDLKHLTQESIRQHIAIVPQETILFGGSIRENILYGKLDATEDEMIQASISANADEFIRSFPNQYDTVVGERGMNLSGGERQRIAIARAILKDPDILLLDEATSSLDNESEELVQEALYRLMENRTTIMIAHRLSTIKAAHRIAVLDEGKIIELGTHEDLMKSSGLYAKLYMLQFRQSEEMQIPL